MSSIVAIYNMALASVGQSETVAATDERSDAARNCNLFYDTCRRQVLEDFDWPFARRCVYLANLGDPQVEWVYRYQYPLDCLKALSIAYADGSLVPPTSDERIPYDVAWSEAGNVILCNEPNARLNYTVDVTDTERYSGQFTDALAYLLGSRIAMPLSAKPELADRCLQNYFNSVQRAQVHAFEQSQQQPDPLPEFIRARR